MPFWSPFSQATLPALQSFPFCLSACGRFVRWHSATDWDFWYLWGRVVEGMCGVLGNDIVIQRASKTALHVYNPVTGPNMVHYWRLAVLWCALLGEPPYPYFPRSTVPSIRMLFSKKNITKIHGLHMSIIIMCDFLYACFLAWKLLVIGIFIIDCCIYGVAARH